MPNLSVINALNKYLCVSMSSNFEEDFTGGIYVHLIYSKMATINGVVVQCIVVIDRKDCKWPTANSSIKTVTWRMIYCFETSPPISK